MATDDELQDSNLGTAKGCCFKEILIPPTPGPVVMVMTMPMNIWGMFLMSCKWRGDYHPRMMTCVIHTCACTHTIFTQTPNKAGWDRQKPWLWAWISLTSLIGFPGVFLPLIVERGRGRDIRKGKKTCINIQFHTSLLLLPNKCWDDNSFIPFWKKKQEQKNPKDTSSQITFTYT